MKKQIIYHTSLLSFFLFFAFQGINALEQEGHRGRSDFPKAPVEKIAASSPLSLFFVPKTSEEGQKSMREWALYSFLMGVAVDLGTMALKFFSIKTISNPTYDSTDFEKKMKWITTTLSFLLLFLAGILYIKKYLGPLYRARNYTLESSEIFLSIFAFCTIFLISSYVARLLASIFKLLLYYPFAYFYLREGSGEVPFFDAIKDDVKKKNVFFLFGVNEKDGIKRTNPSLVFFLVSLGLCFFGFFSSQNLLYHTSDSEKEKEKLEK